ncbi:hypothetical protein GCO76_01310 [Rickettsia sp. R2]|uniref:hypothetical protein n=1 Tax=Rickettsia koreansis TaxID=2358204 RepID=UPI00397BD0F8
MPQENKNPSYLSQEQFINTSLLSVNINEKFLKPSVVTQVKTIEICQQQNSEDPFAINESEIFNQKCKVKQYGI